jgi:hypothetical protein
MAPAQARIAAVIANLRPGAMQDATPPGGSV